MEVTIHRGARTIGGSCIEVRSGESRIVLDAGFPLMDHQGREIDKAELGRPSVENGILPDVRGLYQGDEPGVDAVFITHAHLDHYGLISHVHPSIPVYMSPGTRELIDIGNVFYPPGGRVFSDNRHTLEHWQPLELGPFTVTSHLVDHSAYDASAFLVQAGGNKLFYSGDFRGHGRKGMLLENMVRRPIPDVDCLLMEGTTLKGGHSVGLKNEYEVQAELCSIFKAQRGPSFVSASGSNIDRLVSIYKASRDAGRTLVLDLYTFHVLDRLKKLTPNIPPHPGDHVRIRFIYRHGEKIVEHMGKGLLLDYDRRKIGLDEIIERSPEMVLKLPLTAMDLVARRLPDQGALEGANFIHSMWPGYLDKKPEARAFCEKHGLSPRTVHVSGHAYLEALEALSRALSPKMLVPVHTLSGDDFSNHFDKVARMEDGAPFRV